MLIVKKFGGTSVGDKQRMYNVANRCIEEYKKGNDVVVVLSAMGKYTDELIRMAHDMDDKPPKREMDMLLTIGEQMSVSLMAMVMHKLGVPAVSLKMCIRDRVMGKQSADSVDTVSGCTYSSQGIIQAFRNALNQAKGA